MWISSIDGQIGTGGSVSSGSLSDGNHTITASVTDSGGRTGSASVDLTVGTPPSGPTTMRVSSIKYATAGGRDGKKHLSVTVALVDELGDPVVGASASSLLEHNSGSSWTFTGTTGSEGTVTFSLPNAPSGCYATTVTDVTVGGLTWDPDDPGNVSGELCKQPHCSEPTDRAYHAQAIGDLPTTIKYARRVLDLVPEGTPQWRGDATALSALAFWASGGLEAAQDPFARVVTSAAFCANQQPASRAG